MAVMTHASNRLTEVDYRTLPAAVQNAFTQLMEQADTTRSNDEYLPIMRTLAILAGLPKGEIRKCGCSCTCSVIFDGDHPDAHVIEWTGGFNLGRVQCPGCADAHRETA